jgi:putative membrane protein
VLIPLAIPLGLDRYRSLGHTLTDTYLVTRFGSLVRRRCALSRRSVIGWNLRATYFQRRLGLSTLTATTAAGRQRYRVTDLDSDASIALADAAVPGLLREFLL